MYEHVIPSFIELTIICIVLAYQPMVIARAADTCMKKSGMLVGNFCFDPKSY